MIENKIAYVTGATRGIGKAIASELASSGYKVVGTATSEDGAEKISTALKKMGGHGAVLKLDQQDVREQIESIISRYGAPQVLVNNAGITQDTLLMRMTDKQWDSLMQVNLHSLFVVTQTCVKSMIKSRYGRIISIGSVVGVMGNAGQANYAAAKAGLIGFTKSLALEVAKRGITANIVAPGFIETDMTHKMTQAAMDATMTRIPMQRVGKPDEIAHAVKYLASDNAAYITGQTLHVNGGMYM